VALPLLALTLTKDAVAIAAVTAVYRVAGAAISLPAGLLTDRWHRRSLMVTTSILPGAVLAGLVAAMTFGRADLAMVYAVAAVISACDVAYTLALQAVFPDVVGTGDQLARANGWLMGVEATGEELAGPAAGGVLFGFARRLPFLADAVSFLGCAALVGASVPSAPRRGAHAVPSADGPRARAPKAEAGHRRPKPSWWQDMKTGFSVFNSKPPLKLLAAAMSAISFSQNMVFALMVIYGERVLHLSATGYGLFLGGASVLGVAGLFFGGAAQGFLGASGVVLVGSLACGLSYLGMSFAGIAVVAAVAFGFQELGTAIANVGSVTTRQRLIPRELFGRVGGVHRLFVVVAAPVGALAGGVIADAWSVRGAMLVAGAAELAVVALLAPAVRRQLPGRPRAAAP
jgi:MFS family permease